LWDTPKEPLIVHQPAVLKIYTTDGNARIIKTHGGTFRNGFSEKLTRSGSTYFWWGAHPVLPTLPFVFFDRQIALAS